MSERHTADSTGVQNRAAHEATAQSLVRPDLLGFSFHLAWLCLFMYDVIPGFAGRQTDSFDALNPVYFYSMVSLVAVLVLGIWKTRTFMRFTRSKAGCRLAPLVCSVGTLFYTLCAMGVAQGFFASLLTVVGGVMTGAGSAVMAAHWASVFGRARARAVIMNFTLILVAVMLACLAISYLFPTMSLIVATLLPLGGGASLIYADGYALEPDAGCESHARLHHGRKGYVALVLAVALLGLSTGALPQLGKTGSRFDQTFYCLTSIIILIAVAWLAVLENRRAVLSLIVAPLAVLCVFSMPYVRFTTYEVSGLFYALGNSSFELMLLFEAVLFALLFDLSCARTFMIVRVTMALSDMAGYFLAGVIVDYWGTGAGLQAASTAILIASEIIVGALVVTYQLLRKKDRAAIELNRRAADVYTPGKNDSVPTQTALDATQESQEAHASDKADVVGAVVARHGLSPREADVLRLLVAGESTAQIQDELCIAAGTFNYHMRNIYSKLGVHSRQELLVSIYNQQEQ